MGYIHVWEPVSSSGCILLKISLSLSAARERRSHDSSRPEPSIELEAQEGSDNFSEGFAGQTSHCLRVSASGLALRHSSEHPAAYERTRQRSLASVNGQVAPNNPVNTHTVAPFLFAL